MLEKEVEAVGEPSHSNIKRPKWAEVNFPQGEDPSSLEHFRQKIVEEVKKTEKNLPLIRKMMQTTFALRWQTIVKTCPPVNELMDLWPALKMESEVIWISSLFSVFHLLITYGTFCVV